MAASIGLVIPAYRPDLDRLSGFVAELRDQLDLAALRVEIDDPSPEALDRLEALPVSVGHVPTRRGKGAAITAGFDHLETDVLAFADADGATPSPSVADVLAPVTDGAADLAVGSRRHPDATVVTHQTLIRRKMGDTFAWVARRLLLVGLYDYQCGAKAITAEAWHTIRTHVREHGFAWDIELISLVGSHGGRVLEVPVEWHDRPDSTVSAVSAPIEFGRALVSVRRRTRAIAANQREHPALASEDR